MKKEKEMVCVHCGYKGSPKMKMKGSILIEAILWLCFVIPGLIYSVWRGHTKNPCCPECGAFEMIPATSPVAKKILAGG